MSIQPIFEPESRPLWGIKRLILIISMFFGFLIGSCSDVLTHEILTANEKMIRGFIGILIGALIGALLGVILTFLAKKSN